MRLVADAKYDVCVRHGWVFEDSFAAIMRLRSEGLRKLLMAKFEGSTMVVSPVRAVLP